MASTNVGITLAKWRNHSPGRVSPAASPSGMNSDAALPGGVGKSTIPPSTGPCVLPTFTSTATPLSGSPSTVPGASISAVAVRVTGRARVDDVEEHVPRERDCERRQDRAQEHPAGLVRLPGEAPEPGAIGGH